MNTYSLQLNPGVTNTVIKVGDEQTPVIIIDDFLTDVHGLVDRVCEQVNFDAEKQTYYPGFRARIGEDYNRLVINTLGKHLYLIFDIPKTWRLILDGAFYSLVATPPDQLLPGQCRPHCDTAMPYYLAIMQYLSPGDHGGTGFFRHRQTGFERITPDRINRYKQVVEEEQQLAPPSGYITAGNDTYELIHHIDYKPNRMVVYPGNLLHSGLIKPDTDISKDPRTGRLTANIFLDFVAPR